MCTLEHKPADVNCLCITLQRSDFSPLTLMVTLTLWVYHLFFQGRHVCAEILQWPSSRDWVTSRGQETLGSRHSRATAVQPAAGKSSVSPLFFLETLQFILGKELVSIQYMWHILLTFAGSVMPWDAFWTFLVMGTNIYKWMSHGNVLKGHSKNSKCVALLVSFRVTGKVYYTDFVYYLSM